MDFQSQFTKYLKNSWNDNCFISPPDRGRTSLGLAWGRRGWVGVGSHSPGGWRTVVWPPWPGYRPGGPAGTGLWRPAVGPTTSPFDGSKDNNNIIIIITPIALKSSGTRARKRNKTKSLIIFKSRAHTGVIISLWGRRLFKVDKTRTRIHRLQILARYDATVTLHNAFFNCNAPFTPHIKKSRACLGSQLTICAQKWRNFVCSITQSLKFVWSWVCVFLYSLGPYQANFDQSTIYHQGKKPWW